MTILIAPCKGCERREVGCHSVCEEYLTFRRLKDEQKAELVKKAKQEQIQNDIERDRKKKIATGKFWRSKRTKT